MATPATQQETPRSRITESAQELREDQLARIHAVIGRKLTDEEISLLASSPQALEQVEFHANKALAMVAGWFKK